MVGGKASTVLFYVALTFFSAFLAAWLLDFRLLRVDWCAGAEMACFRQWIGALSGRAAAAGAGLTIFVLYGQLVEQRKQTAFALGDALPTITANHPKGRLEDVALRIVNWNRYAADILAVRVAESEPPLHIALSSVVLADKTAAVDMDPVISGIVRLDGWENRAAAPPFAEIRAYVTIDGQKLDESAIVRTTFAVDLLLFGEEPRIVTVRAKMNMRAGDL